MELLIKNTMDAISLERIKLAHPKVRAQLLKDYTDANNLLGKGARLRLAYVYRSPEEQDMLFKKKPKVTNAKAWQSIHNYGLAFDIVMLYDNDGDGKFEEASWSMTRDFDKDTIADWKEVTNLFKSRGWSNGGDWASFKDFPHFEMNFGFNWQRMKAMIDAKKYTIENGIKYITI
jgi:peptidoglycan L-alanyl-D-glutamate endopeptidase CwlK